MFCLLIEIRELNFIKLIFSWQNTMENIKNWIFTLQIQINNHFGFVFFPWWNILVTLRMLKPNRLISQTIKNRKKYFRIDSKTSFSYFLGGLFVKFKGSVSFELKIMFLSTLKQKHPSSSTPPAFVFLILNLQLFQKPSENLKITCIYISILDQSFSPFSNSFNHKLGP